MNVKSKNYAFEHYSFGIITDDNTCGTDLDHAVLAVGYGVDNGQPYYLVKNSWGEDWGEDGYFRIGMNGDGPGVCGIQM